MERNFLLKISMLTVVVLLLIGAVFLESQYNVGQAELGVGGGPNEDETVITQIVEDTEQYIGQTVTVNGEVEEMLTPGVFVLDQEGTIFADEILVISQRMLPDDSDEDRINPFGDADKVIVTGEVRRLVITELEREFGIDLDPEVEVEFRDRPVIIADDVRLQEEE